MCECGAKENGNDRIKRQNQTTNRARAEAKRENTKKTRNEQKNDKRRPKRKRKKSRKTKNEKQINDLILGRVGGARKKQTIRKGFLSLEGRRLKKG